MLQQGRVEINFHLAFYANTLYEGAEVWGGKVAVKYEVT